LQLVKDSLPRAKILGRHCLKMGCGQSAAQPQQGIKPAGTDARLLEAGQAEEAEPLTNGSNETAEPPASAPEPPAPEPPPPPKLVEAAHPLLATSEDRDTQKIINRVTQGEDFTENKSRCLHTPDRAYYTLSPFAQLEIELVEARKLIPSVTTSFESYAGDEPDAFVKVYVDDCFKYSTKYVKDKRNPQWNDKQKFDIVANRCMVRLHVYDTDSSDCSKVDPLGFVEFCVGDMPFDQEIDGWLELRFPANLQGTNLDRYDLHCTKREEEWKYPGAIKPPKDAEPSGEEGDESVEPTVKAGQKMPHSLASRMFKRMRAGADTVAALVTGQEATKRQDEEVQFNAGEIHVKMKLVKVVDDSAAAYSQALVPSYFTYASYIQEEFLPKLDIQELVDDIMDVKIKLFDDMIFAFASFVNYILAWRSFFLSGLLLAMVLVCAIHDGVLIAYGIWHMWLAIVFVMLSNDTWRHEMTTSGLNAPLDQEGFLAVAKWNETSEMHAFLVRIIQARLGTIISMQELVHFAGTICEGERGQVPITYDELLQAMHDLWFLDLPHKELVQKGTLVRVNERRRGTAQEVTGTGVHQKVKVVFDEPSFDHTEMDGVYPKQIVLPRITVPGVPRMLVPKSVQAIVAVAMYQVNDFKENLLPVAAAIRKFFVWNKPQYMVPLLVFLVGRALLSFYAWYDEDSWSFFIISVLATIRNSILGIVIIALLFSKSRAVRVFNSILQIIRSRTASRNAPEGWTFYKAADQPYKLDSPV